MHTKQALHELGISANDISAEQKQQLDEQGFFVVENVLSKSDTQTMRDEFERVHALEAHRGGHEVHVDSLDERALCSYLEASC